MAPSLTSQHQNEIVVNQDTHDDLNANVNLQVGDADVDAANPVPVTGGTGATWVIERKNEADAAVIANAAWLSGEIDFREYTMMVIHMPAAWTANPSRRAID